MKNEETALVTHPSLCLTFALNLHPYGPRHHSVLLLISGLFTDASYKL